MDQQMIFNLPTHDYRLEGKSFIKKIERKLKNHVPIDMNERGMFLEVDLEYPEGIHNQHEDFPMAPERYIVKYNELSPLNQYLYRKMKTSDFFTNYAEEKLIPTFHDRKNYVLHIQCLIFYLS